MVIFIFLVCPKNYSFSKLNISSHFPFLNKYLAHYCGPIILDLRFSGHMLVDSEASDETSQFGTTFPSV